LKEEGMARNAQKNLFEERNRLPLLGGSKQRPIQTVHTRRTEVGGKKMTVPFGPARTSSHLGGKGRLSPAKEKKKFRGLSIRRKTPW